MKNMFKGQKGSQFLLAIVLIIYIVCEIKTPKDLAKLIDNVVGNIVVIVIALCMFVGDTSPKIVGILALLAAYVLIKRSSEANGTHGLRNYVPTEEKKSMDFSQYNEFPVTLEEEVVAKMAPLIKSEPAPNANYKPVLDGLHDAAPINYEGVI
tara:strand:- start:191 stop:649 length:459 start_codon:yes stop_codon:yes gene_type:complete